MASNEFNEGCNAFIFGEGINNNPYRPGTQEYFDWNNAWLLEFDDDKVTDFL